MRNNNSIFVRHSDPGNTPAGVNHSKWLKAKTLTIAYAQCILLEMSQLTQTIKDTSGTNRACSTGQRSLSNNAAAGATTWGIQIGTGQTATTRNDYSLQTQVSTNIYHGAVSYELTQPDANTQIVLLHRSFTNNTAAAINVHEVALVSRWQDFYCLCLDHTLFDVTIPTGTTKIVTYALTL